ncbi:capsid protein [Leuconostoc gelidum subsp. gasicomitatum]|uniref:phage tail tube protein n=1 Tax=Leuconostoc gasicomitatum TaxID=115778 RepID=UPI001CC5CED6|nr:capsid protein [Leuconostoc gasicomitatum]MBZ5943913.1 capsid protein [Leuconostoc gasicomitatum]MBZ5973022.1 capsid protein [Leuconostoc gasicomitatum]
MGKFNENYQNKLEIDTTGNTSLADVTKATWATLAAGIQTITPAASETADTTPYYDGEGFSDVDVTGKAVTFAIAGHRIDGDAAQDYVADKFIAVGDTLRTLARWTDPKGNQVQFVATLQAIVPFGGAANVKQTFSFTLAANGKPQAVAASTPAPTPKP